MTDCGQSGQTHRADDAPRDECNDPRVALAAERTLLAWIRTGLALMGFGFVVARFGLFLHEMAAVTKVPAPRGGYSIWFGTALVLVGAVVNLWAALQHYRFNRRLRRGEPITPGASLAGILLSVLLAALGVLMAAYLLGMSE